MTTEPNFIPVVRKYHSQNNHLKNEPIDSTEKLNPDYTEIVSNNADHTIDVRENIITNNNNHSRITESKCGEHDKTRNKTTKENNFKPYAFIIGDRMIKNDGHLLAESIT